MREQEELSVQAWFARVLQTVAVAIVEDLALEHPEAHRGKVKVNPLAAWSQADVDAYISRYGVPVNPLIKLGYGSVGCWPCTRRTKAGEDPRAGRWPMFDKTECGLHAA